METTTIDVKVGYDRNTALNHLRNAYFAAVDTAADLEVLKDRINDPFDTTGNDLTEVERVNIRKAYAKLDSTIGLISRAFPNL